VPEAGHHREAERDIQAGLEMARHLLGLSKREFDKYKVADLHIVPRAAWNRLTKDEKQAARRKGIAFKGDDYQTHSGISVEELPIADSQLDPEEIMESAEKIECGAKTAHPITELSADERTWYALRQVLDMIISAPNSRLEAECFRISSGLGELDDITEASIARKHGLTRAAISKRCVRQTKLLGLRPSQFMRSLNMREVYRKARNRSLKMRDS